MKDKYDKIRELQEQRDRQERQARDQASELEEILEASRRADAEERGLVSASKLSGPGYDTLKKRPSTNPEDAYSSNMAKARFASPEAFSRNRATPSSVPDGSVAGMVARVASSISASASGTSTTREREPDEPRTEHTVTMTVKGLPPSRTEVTQVVRRRSPLPGKVRREPPPVAPINLTTTSTADGPAIVVREQLPAPPQPAPSDDTPIVVPQVQRVTFQRRYQPSDSRMVTSRPANYGSFKAMTTTTNDTAPFGPEGRRRQYMRDIDTAPGNQPASEREITAPGQSEGTPPHDVYAEHDTSPGMGDIDPTSPGMGGVDPTSPGMSGIDSTSPGRIYESTSPGNVEDTPMPGTFPGTVVERINNDPTAADDQRYKRVREIDALIARFAADVEVKVGQGRENTFLRKRSEIVPDASDFDAEFPEESTQPRHRNIEIRRENTEIIPRRLPPRKRK